MSAWPIKIDHPEDLEPLGEAAALLGVALSLVDAQLNVTWRNRVAAEWFGPPSGEERHCFAWHWGYTERCADCLPLLVFGSGEPGGGIRVRGRPGACRNAYRVSALPVQSCDGRRHWVLEAMIPLHQLTRSLSARSDFEQSLKEVPSESATAFLVVDLAGRIVSWSPSATAVFGYDLEEILGRKVNVLTPSNLRHESDEIVNQITIHGAVPRTETVRLAKDGRLVPVALAAAALRDESGELIGYSTVLEDLSEVQRLRERLHAGSRLLAKLVKDMGEAVLSTDAKGVVSIWSAEAEEMLGLKEGDAVGRPLGDVIGPESAGVLLDVLASGQAIRRRRMSWQPPGSGLRLVEVSATVLGTGPGPARELAIIARDAGESERLEHRMVRSEKLATVGSLAAGLAHEIGTPLNVISATVEYLLLDQPLAGGARSELSVILDETERIGRLVRDLLAFAREGPAMRVRVEIRQVFEKAAALLHVPLEKRGVRLETDLPATLPSLSADPDGLLQILVNVLVNSATAVPEAGRIRMVARCDPGPAPAAGVRIEIHDNGPGLPPGLRERVFDPFYTTRPEGTGLGLTVCARIVQAHGGDIRITGSPLGGACVVVTLPALADGNP